MDSTTLINDLQNDVRHLSARLTAVDKKVATHRHLGSDLTSKLDSRAGVGDGIHYVNMRVLTSTAFCFTGTSIGGTFEVPTTATLDKLGAYVDTAGSSGDTVVDVLVNGSSILSTEITVESMETSSRTAAVQPAIASGNVVPGDIVTINVDSVSSSSKGLVIRFALI